jgi:hypothetical protein
MLPILDVEAGHIKIEGLDKLSDAANSASALFGEFIGLVAVTLIFSTPIIIILAVLRHRARRQQAMNEMILKLAEKGQPIPPQVFDLPSAGPRSDLRRGIKLIAVGLGIMGFFYFQDVREAIGIGFIPLAIGVGYLLSSHFDKEKPAP